jgi:hypothetical protein
MQTIEEENEEVSSIHSNESYDFDFDTVPLLLQEITIPTMATTPTGTTTAPTAATTARAFTLGGRSYTPRAVNDPKPILDETDEVLHKKDDRAKLTADDRASLFEKAVKLSHKKYEPMPLSLEDADKLDDAYNLDVLIKYTKRSHYTYDMHDVFLVVYPKDGTEANMVDYTKDLYTQYADISIEDVARSNEWYRTWMNEAWFVQNLQLTHSFFQNNVSDELWMKVSETYESFNAGEKGGPLFFILMMNHLLSDTEEAASALVAKVKTFEIRKITGEDIYKVVSLLRGAINRLTYIHKLPEDIIKILLQVFQTTSVDDFNATFHLLAKQRKQHAVLRRTGAPPDFLPADIFTLAESEYRDMQTLNTWSGVHTKGSSAFNAGHPSDGTGTTTQLCFNCGGPHHVKECKKPRDENKINQAAANFKTQIRKKQEDRKSGGGGNKHDGKNAKWAAPQKHENNKRMIDGKPMYWLHHRKRWIPDAKANAGKQAHLASKKKETERETPPDSVPAETGSTADKVLMANKFKQLQATFTAFSNDMMNH